MQVHFAGKCLYASHFCRKDCVQLTFAVKALPAKYFGQKSSVCKWLCGKSSACKSFLQSVKWLAIWRHGLILCPLPPLRFPAKVIYCIKLVYVTFAAASVWMTSYMHLKTILLLHSSQSVGNKHVCCRVNCTRHFSELYPLDVVDDTFAAIYKSRW